VDPISGPVINSNMKYTYTSTISHERKMINGDTERLESLDHTVISEFVVNV